MGEFSHQRNRVLCHAGDGNSTAYRDEAGGAETGAAVKPVIVAKLVDLDALLVGRRLMRHGLCHHQALDGLVSDVDVEGGVAEQVGCDIEMVRRLR